MKRSIPAFFAALITWVLVASIINRGLRYGIEGYAAAEPTMAFSLGMMISRLLMGAAASMAAGAVMALIAPASTRLPWIFAILVLAAFVPTHIQLWALFPIWYHLTFLGTIVPLVILGWRMGMSRRSGDQLATPNPI